MIKNYNTKFYIVIAASVILCSSIKAATTAISPVTTAKVAAYFHQECETAIINEINTARKEIKLAIYTFTRPSIYRALAKAHRRNVDIEVKYDSEAADWDGMKNAIDYLKKAGITCIKISPKKGVTGKMHNKYIIIDRKIVITGSYNYTTAATNLNYENIVVIYSNKIAQQFYQDYISIQ